MFEMLGGGEVKGRGRQMNSELGFDREICLCWRRRGQRCGGRQRTEGERKA